MADRGALYEIPTLDSARTEVVMASCAMGVTVTMVAARRLWSVALVTVTVTEVLLVTLGAVNWPLLVMVPADADQRTAVFEVPVTLALNCRIPCEVTVGVPGETEIVAVCPLPPAAMMIRTGALPVSCQGRSETDRLKLYSPATVGMPEIEPVEGFKDSPGGRIPFSGT